MVWKKYILFRVLWGIRESQSFPFGRTLVRRESQPMGISYNTSILARIDFFILKNFFRRVDGVGVFFFFACSLYH